METSGMHSSEHWLVPGEVEVCEVGDLTSGPCTVVAREALEKVVFLYLQEGEAKVWLSDVGEQILSKGEILIIFPGRILTIELTAKSNRLMSVVMIGPGAVRAALGLGYWDLLRTMESYEGNYMTQIIERFHSSPERGRDARLLSQVEHLLSTVWLRLRHGSGRGEFYEYAREINCRICRGECLTTEKLATALQVSRSKLNALFMAGMGVRPGEYMARGITALAEAQLFWTTAPVRQISEGFGFASVSSFAVFFRRRVGLTPAEFRHRPLNKIAQKAQNRSE